MEQEERVVAARWEEIKAEIHEEEKKEVVQAPDAVAKKDVIVAGPDQSSAIDSSSQNLLQTSNY